MLAACFDLAEEPSTWTCLKGKSYPSKQAGFNLQLVSEYVSSKTVSAVVIQEVFVYNRRFYLGDQEYEAMACAVDLELLI